MSDLRICPKGRDGVCVGGQANGETCPNAKPHPCDEWCSKTGDCHPCIPYVPPAPADVPTPETDAVLEDGFERRHFTEFARSLERRLAGALKELDELKGRLT